MQLWSNWLVMKFRLAMQYTLRSYLCTQTKARLVSHFRLLMHPQGNLEDRVLLSLVIEGLHSFQMFYWRV